MIYNNILETIGDTPLVRLNTIVKDVPATVLGKIETFNPGHSIKDRMALKMLLDAEQSGKIKAGGTIIECTSGNTGMGLAIAACVKGYRCIFTTSDKQSKEKVDMLKAHGAQVIVCPTNVAPEDPRSYYSVAERLSKEIPNSVWINQYDNLANRAAHYETTGPEIWDQTQGKVTHLVVGVGTGGTISGVAKYLKEQNPSIKVWGVDTYGSVFKKYHETGVFDRSEIYSYITEGIGEDILPANVDFSLIDHFEKVTDKDGAVMARRLAREEGLLLGYSAGSAMAAVLQMRHQLSADDLVVVIFHDHGSRYVAKLFNDEWMRDHGFLDEELTIGDVLQKKRGQKMIAIGPEAGLEEAFDVMKAHDISQLPVVEGPTKMLGAITERIILDHILSGGNRTVPVQDLMADAFPIVSPATTCSQARSFFTPDCPAVLCKDLSGTFHIITQYDIIQSL